MAATKQPGFRQGASAAAALNDPPSPTAIAKPTATSGTEREDTILAKRRLGMRSKPTQPKAASAARQKSFSGGKPPTAKSTAPYVKRLGR